MDYLTGVPSLAVRELAMLMWRHAMSKCADTAVATAVHIATNHVGQGRSMNPEDYITQMTKSAAAWVPLASSYPRKLPLVPLVPLPVAVPCAEGVAAGHGALVVGVLAPRIVRLAGVR